MRPPTTDPAAPLAPERAADLLRLVDLAARWENQPRGPAAGVAGLRDRQRAYDAFRERQAAYLGRYGDRYEPGTAIGTLARLAAWCRWVGGLCRQAGVTGAGDQPADAVEKARRVVARLTAGGPETSTTHAATAADELDAIARWCDGRAGSAGRPLSAAA